MSKPLGEMSKQALVEEAFRLIGIIRREINYYSTRFPNGGRIIYLNQSTTENSFETMYMNSTEGLNTIMQQLLASVTDQDAALLTPLFESINDTFNETGKLAYTRITPAGGYQNPSMEPHDTFNVQMLRSQYSEKGLQGVVNKRPEVPEPLPQPNYLAEGLFTEFGLITYRVDDRVRETTPEAFARSLADRSFPPGVKEALLKEHKELYEEYIRLNQHDATHGQLADRRDFNQRARDFNIRAAKQLHLNAAESYCQRNGISQDETKKLCAEFERLVELAEKPDQNLNELKRDAANLRSDTKEAAREAQQAKQQAEAQAAKEKAEYEASPEGLAEKRETDKQKALEQQLMALQKQAKDLGQEAGALAHDVKNLAEKYNAKTLAGFTQTNQRKAEYLTAAMNYLEDPDGKTSIPNPPGGPKEMANKERLEQAERALEKPIGLMGKSALAQSSNQELKTVVNAVSQLKGRIEGHENSQRKYDNDMKSREKNQADSGSISAKDSRKNDLKSAYKSEYTEEYGKKPNNHREHKII